MYIEDRRPTDLPFWKILNGHISATGHPIHFVFGSSGVFKVGGLDQIQDGVRLPSWKMLNGHISATSYAIHFAFGSMVGFSGRRIEWPYIRFDQIQDRGRQPSCIILNGHWPYL